MFPHGKSGSSGMCFHITIPRQHVWYYCGSNETWPCFLLFRRLGEFVLLVHPYKRSRHQMMKCPKEVWVCEIWSVTFWSPISLVRAYMFWKCKLDLRIAQWLVFVSISSVLGAKYHHNKEKDIGKARPLYLSSKCRYFLF